MSDFELAPMQKFVLCLRDEFPYLSSKERIAISKIAAIDLADLEQPIDADLVTKAFEFALEINDLNTASRALELITKRFIEIMTEG